MHIFELAAGRLCGIEGGDLQVGATPIDTPADTHVSPWNDTTRFKLILAYCAELVVYIYVVQTGIDFQRWYAIEIGHWQVGVTCNNLTYLLTVGMNPPRKM
jgi:hypothetical protein